MSGITQNTTAPQAPAPTPAINPERLGNDNSPYRNAAITKPPVVNIGSVSSKRTKGNDEIDAVIARQSPGRAKPSATTRNQIGVRAFPVRFRRSKSCPATIYPSSQPAGSSQTNFPIVACDRPSTLDR